MKTYKYGDWDFEFGDCGYHDPDQNIYIDINQVPITGILEDFYYYSEGDERNNQYVENGKRIIKEQNEKY